MHTGITPSCCQIQFCFQLKMKDKTIICKPRSTCEIGPSANSRILKMSKFIGYFESAPLKLWVYSKTLKMKISFKASKNHGKIKNQEGSKRPKKQGKSTWLSYKNSKVNLWLKKNKIFSMNQDYPKSKESRKQLLQQIPKELKAVKLHHLLLKKMIKKPLDNREQKELSKLSRNKNRLDPYRRV